MEKKVTYKERIFWKSGSDEIYTYYSIITPFNRFLEIYYNDMNSRVLKIELYIVENGYWKPLLTYDRAKQEEYNANKNH